MKTAIIIQARMNSTRLPGKVLMPMIGKPVLKHIIDRCCRADVDRVIIATCKPEKEICNLVNGCDARKVKVFVGDENNVYQRVLDAAKYFKIDIIVEVTGDCPLVDPVEINRLLNIFKDKKTYSYVSNCEVRLLPDGFDLQVYKTSTLKNINPKNTNHVGWNILNYLINNTSKKLLSYQPTTQRRYQQPYWGLTIDEEEDYKCIKKIFEYFGHNNFTTDDVMEMLFRHPEILAINNHVKRKRPGDG